MKTAIEIAMEKTARQTIEGEVVEADWCGHPSIGSLTWLRIQTSVRKFSIVSHEVVGLPHKSDSREYLGLKMRVFYLATEGLPSVHPLRVELVDSNVE
jgi:predicted PhzF superfamily epimerase YddE/YHI9